MSLFNLSNQQVARRVSKAVYKNLYQDILHKDGYGITDNFITPEMANTGTVVDVYVPIPLNGKFRMRGAQTNGLWTNTKNLPDAKTGQRRHALSKRFTIDVLKRYDENIAISEDEVAAHPKGLDEGFEQICKKQIEQDIARSINGYTFASQLYAFFMDSFSEEPTEEEIAEAVEFYTYNGTDKTVALMALQLANAKVSNGNSKLYRDYEPADERQCFIFNNVHLVHLRASLAMTASDAATLMLGQGGINPFTKEKAVVADFETGAVGVVDAVPLYSASANQLNTAIEYLGLDPAANAEAIGLIKQLASMIAPANATIRGLKPNTFKTVDDPDEQGVIVQPKVNMGVRCLSGNSIKVVFYGKDFTTLEQTKESIKKIRADVKGKLVLPNLSYDEDHLIGVDSYIQVNADGTMEKAVEGRATTAITTSAMTRMENNDESAREDKKAKKNNKNNGNKNNEPPVDTGSNGNFGDPIDDGTEDGTKE